MANINTSVTPRRRTIGGFEIVDLRNRYPIDHGHPRSLSEIDQDVVHHDAVLFPPGDRNFNGSTLDEDLRRLDALYRHAIDERGFGRFPYHKAASPNGRLFYTLDIGQIGAHVGGHNTRSDSLVFLGDFSGETSPTGLALCAGARGLRITWHQLRRLVAAPGHKEVDGQATRCPGDRWHAWRRDLLDIAAAL